LARRVAVAATGKPQPNTGSNIEVAKPQMFNGEIEKMLGFLTACRLFIRMRIRDESLEGQIQ